MLVLVVAHDDRPGASEAGEILTRGAAVLIEASDGRLEGGRRRVITQRATDGFSYRRLAARAWSQRLVGYTATGLTSEEVTVLIHGPSTQSMSAKALGLTIPQSLLVRADEIIQ